MTEDKKRLVKWTELALVFTAGAVLLALLYEICRKDSAYPPFMIEALRYTLCVFGVVTLSFFLMAYLYFTKLFLKLLGNS